MLTLLSQNQYSLIQPLLNTLSIHLVTRSIQAGSTPAEVFVDNSTHPSLVIARAGHRCLLSGDPGLHPELQTWFQQVFFPGAAERGDQGFGLYYSPEGWAEHLPGVLAGKQVYITDREYFAGTARNSDWRSSLPEGFSLRPVTAELLNDSEISGLDDLREEMCSERPSVADFLQQSFGLAAIYANRLAGWCLSEYNSLGACEIGIATMPAYRQRGLAVCMTQAFAEMALQHGIERIGWHCYASNIPSSATARRAGLTKICDYKACVTILR